jgi:hypothetical protein
LSIISVSAFQKGESRIYEPSSNVPSMQLPQLRKREERRKLTDSRS